MKPADKGYLLISLEEPVRILKNEFHSYVELILSGQIEQVRNKTIDVRHVQNYNTRPFFIELLKDLFMNNKKDEIGAVSSSTQVLIEDGMDETYAKMVALRVFRSTISLIATFIPDVDFTDDGYRFSIYGEYDLMVEPPYRDMVDPRMLYRDDCKYD